MAEGPVTEVTTPGQKPSYSDRVRDLGANNGSWIVAARKKKRITPVTGSGESSTLEGVAKLKRDFWEIAVSRLKEGTTEDKLKTHLHGKGIEVREAFVFPSKIKGAVAAKVRVALEYKERAFDAANWPPHIRVLSWTNRSKAEKRNDAANRPVAAAL